MKSTLQDLFTDERAVSPVVGVALLIAIAVILAAIIAAVVLGLGVGPTESPQATVSFETEADGSGGYDVTMIHDGGDALDANDVQVVIGDDRQSLSDHGYSDDAMTAGDSVTINSVAEGEIIRIVWEDPESDSSTLLETFTV